MLLQNLHRCYLYIVIRLPKLKDLEQRIPTFLNSGNYGKQRSSNPNLTSDDVKLNDDAFHQEKKINETRPALLPNKIIQTSKGPLTATGTKGQLHFCSVEKRAILVMAILQAGVAIGGTLIKGINALVDEKRAKSFDNAIKMVAANVELTHQRLMTLENRMSMMAKAIM